MRNEQFTSALYILMALGYSPERQMSSKEMAMGLQTNPVVVRRLMGLLSQAGLIQSQKGRSGGIRLARRPDQISLADIYKAVELPEMIRSYQKPALKACAVSCSMKKIVGNVSEGLEKDIRKSLSQTKLSDLIKKVN